MMTMEGDADDKDLIQSLSENKKPIIVVVVLLIAVIVIYAVYVNLPYIMMGEPLPFYNVSNQDDSSHQVHLEIYDDDNECVIERDYELASDSSVKYEERPGEGNYRVNVTLDGNLTVEDEVEVHDEWYSIDIDIGDDPDPEEKIEIEVEMV